MKQKAYFAIIIVGIALILMLQNIQRVSIDFFFWSFELPLIILIAFCVILGALAGYLFSYGRQRKKEKSV